jgi:hypothetical protein
MDAAEEKIWTIPSAIAGTCGSQVVTESKRISGAEVLFIMPQRESCFDLLEMLCFANLHKIIVLHLLVFQGTEGVAFALREISRSCFLKT